jgi:hypothetical protein
MEAGISDHVWTIEEVVNLCIRGMCERPEIDLVAKRFSPQLVVGVLQSMIKREGCK